MKKKKSKVLKIVLIVIAVLIILAIVFLGKPLYQISKMSPLKTGAVINDIFAVNNGNVNMFIMPIGDKYLAIDAGSNSKNIENELNVLGISPADITVVLLTHTHNDHTGALSIFNNATVYMGNGSLPEKFSLPSKQMSDGETFEISGVSVKCIYAPGHKNDSVVFIVNEKIMFSGDNFSLVDGKADLFVSIFNADDEQQKRDIEKLADIEGIEHIFTAHHGYAAGPVQIESRD